MAIRITSPSTRHAILATLFHNIILYIYNPNEGIPSVT